MWPSRPWPVPGVSSSPRASKTSAGRPRPSPRTRGTSRCRSSPRRPLPARMRRRGEGTWWHDARLGHCSCCRRSCWRLSSGCPGGRRRPPAPCFSALGGPEVPVFRDTRVHVVIPAYNVADRIGAVLCDMPRLVDAVTVVDDGSIDGTPAAVRAVNDPRVTLLESPRNEGVGSATVRGFRHALSAGDGIIVKLDGDGQMDPGDLPWLLAPIADGQCEYTKGNRFLRSRELDIMPRARLIGNFVLTFLTKLASGYWNVFDPQNGYLAMTSGTLRLLDLDRLARRYFFENDMLINLNIFDARVRDVALPSRYGDERSSMRLARVMCSFPFYLVHGYW